MLEGFPETNPIVFRIFDGGWFCRKCDSEIQIGEWAYRHARNHVVDDIETYKVSGLGEMPVKKD